MSKNFGMDLKPVSSMSKTVIRKYMRMQANACFLDLIKFDKYAIKYLEVQYDNRGEVIITVRPFVEYILPSHAVFILEWCREHGISALVISYGHNPSIKFESYV